MRALRPWIVAFLLVTGTGCGLPGLVPEPPPDCLIPPGTEFEFAGKSTLAALDLDDVGPYKELPGTVYVTADPISAQGTPQRWWCIVFDKTAAAEGLSMSGVAAYGPLDTTTWQAPASP